MYFKISKLIVKNLGSYGNAETSYEFQEGLSLITAKNGCGKSFFFLDGLCYNLYGKPYRNIKISEIANRKNRKGLYSEGFYEKDKDTRFRIVRTPTKLEIYKNDEVEPMKTSSSKLIDQEEINNLIGIDHNIFKMIIAVATNTNEPFLSLGLPKKREVMESIFSIKIFGEMLKKARVKLNSLKTEKTVISSNLKTQESSLISLKKQLDEIERSIKDFEQNKIDEFRKVEEQKSSILLSIEELKQTILDTQLKLSKIVLDEVDHNSKLISLESSIKIEENSIKDKKSQIKFLEKSTTCPLCNHNLTEEHKTTELEKLNSFISTSQKKIDDSKKKLVNLNEKISKQKELRNSHLTLNNIISLTNVKISNAEKNVSDLEKQSVKILDRTLNIDINALKLEYSDKINIYKSDAKKSEELSLQIKKHEIVCKMLSEEGIKSYFFKKLIPILNSMINDTLSKFDLPVTINFDETMQEKISMIGGSEKDISYNSFSEGEKKRIDVAILLAFISTMKKISNWNCNVIIFDEILDGATDSEGLEKLLTSIKELTLNDNQVGAYVISHREVNHDMFSRVITIKKVGGYSKIEVK